MRPNQPILKKVVFVKSTMSGDRGKHATRRLSASLALVIAAGLASAATASASPTFVVSSRVDAPLAEPSGTTCVSTDGGACTLRAAVQAADNLGGESSIELPPGEYKLEIPSTSANSAANGDLDVNGTDTSITIEGDGAGDTTINANHFDRAFAVQAGESLTVASVTIRNGAQPFSGPGEDSTDKGYGGAFLNLGQLTVRDCVLSGNSAFYNGGVIAAGESATSTDVEYCTVEHNTSEHAGGVVSAEAGVVQLDHDDIGFNTADEDGGVLDYDRTGEAGNVGIYDTNIYRNISGGDGGALDLQRADALEIADSEFYENTSYDSDGGAIDDENSGPISVYQTWMGYNTSGDSEGGAIYADADDGLGIHEATIVDNTAGASDGGGVYTDETDLTVEEALFGGNQGGEGGAIYVDGTSAESPEMITDVAFWENEATDEDGGAVYDDYGFLAVEQSTFSGNSANEDGGGLYYDSSDRLMVANDTFTNNLAAYRGGAIALEVEASGEEEANLLNDTIVGNVAYEGGGIYQPEHAEWIQNTIVADNVGGVTRNGGGDCFGSHVTDNAGESDAGGNIDSDATCFLGSVENDHIGVDPKLGELAWNGGPTQTMALLNGSPAIGGGAANGPLGCPDVDQRYIERTGPCDSGAYQRVPVAISLSEFAPTESEVGHSVSYELSVYNGGPGSAHELSVTDELPAGAVLEGATIEDGSCEGEHTVVCHIDAMDQHQTLDIGIRVRLEDEGSITDEATLGAEEEATNPSEEEASATTDVGPDMTTTTTTTTTTESTQSTKTVEVVKTLSTVQTVDVPVQVSGSVSAPAPQCKSDRTETIDWKVPGGVHLTSVLVTANGKTLQTLPGSARTATVSMVGMPKGRVVVKVVGLTHSKDTYSMTRVYHLCVPHRPGPRDPSDFLTLVG